MARCRRCRRRHLCHLPSTWRAHPPSRLTKPSLRLFPWPFHPRRWLPYHSSPRRPAPPRRLRRRTSHPPLAPTLPSPSESPTTKTPSPGRIPLRRSPRRPKLNPTWIFRRPRCPLLRPSGRAAPPRPRWFPGLGAPSRTPTPSVATSPPGPTIFPRTIPLHGPWLSRRATSRFLPNYFPVSTPSSKRPKSAKDSTSGTWSTSPSTGVLTSTRPLTPRAPGTTLPGPHGSRRGRHRRPGLKPPLPGPGRPCRPRHHETYPRSHYRS